MNFFTFKKLGRTLLLAAVAAVCLVGCGGGDDNNPADNGGNNTGSNTGGDNTGGNNTGGGKDTTGGNNTVWNNTCTSAGSCKSKEMPDGKTWLTENLNYQTSSGSWCYNGSADSCAKYGRLYKWEAAVSACQSVGMRLPTIQEWKDLITAAGGVAGKKLKSTSGWNRYGNGADDFGFSALPGGYLDSAGRFYYAGNNGYWWTGTKTPDGTPNAYGMSYIDDYVSAYYGEGGGYSVRCIKN